MTKPNDIVKNICEIGIFSAIGYILDEFQSIFFKGVFINGGSIGFAMIVVLIIGYRRGFLSALLTGLIIGLFDLATGAYIIHPAQLLLDYLLPYACVSLGLLIKPAYDKSQHKCFYIIIGTIIGGLCKFLSHFISGIVFWGDPTYFAWGLNTTSATLYSLIYNIAFMGPSIVITTLLMVLLYKKGGNKIFNITQSTNSVATPIKEKNNKTIIASSLTLALGSFLFIYFLIDYCKSFALQSNTDSIQYTFSQDSMLIFILGFFLLFIGLTSLILSIKKIRSNSLLLNGYLLLATISIVYSIIKLIISAQKDINLINYLIWLIVSLIIITISIIALIYNKKKSC